MGWANGRVFHLFTFIVSTSIQLVIFIYKTCYKLVICKFEVKSARSMVSLRPKEFKLNFLGLERYL